MPSEKFTDSISRRRFGDAGQPERSDRWVCIPEVTATEPFLSLPVHHNLFWLKYPLSTRLVPASKKRRRVDFTNDGSEMLSLDRVLILYTKVGDRVN